MSGAAPAILVAAAGVGVGHAVMPDHWMPLAVVGRVNHYRSPRVARLAALAGAAHVIFSLILGAIIVIIGLQFRASIEGAQDTIVGAILLATGVLFVALEFAGCGHRHGPGGHTHGPGGHIHGPGGHTHPIPGEHDHGHALDHDQPVGHDHEPGHAHTDSRGHEHPLDDGHHDHETHAHAHAHTHAAAVAGSRRRRLFTVIVPLGAAASPDLTILPVFLAATAAGVAAAIGTLIIFALATIGTIVGLTVVAFLTGYKLEGHWLDRWGNAITAGVLLIIGGLVITHVI